MQKNYPTSDDDSWGLAPEGLELVEDEIHVWRAYLDCEEIALRQFEATLSPDDKARAKRFFFHRDRSRFIATRGILRELLGGYVKLPPERLEFDYGPQGKPTLRTELPQQGIRFNVSRSHGVALLAFSVGRHSGVDVELIRNFAGNEIAEHYFPPGSHGIAAAATVFARRRFFSLLDTQGGLCQSKRRRIARPTQELSRHPDTSKA